MINQFFIFLIVGLFGLIIDFSSTFLCKEKLLLNKYFSNFIGSVLMTVSNFWMNRVFTFESSDPEIASQFFWFIGISSIALIIYNSVVWMIVNKWEMNFYIAKMLAIFIITFWNFFTQAYLFSITLK